MNKMIRMAGVLAGIVSLAACGGGESGGSPDPAPPVTPTPTSSTLYIGYYTESNVADPDDPTPGVLYLYLPDTGTSFTGEFFFSYVGCVGATDTGLLDGLRVNAPTGDTINGSWSGDVDGNIHTGNFSGAMFNGNMFTGTWTRNGGSQKFSFGKAPFTCSYTFAGNGDFTLYAVNDGTLPIDVDLTQPTVPVFRFDLDPNIAYYTLDVLDEACLAAGGGVASCLMWELRTVSTGGPVSVVYGTGGTPDQPLTTGNYVVTVVSTDLGGVVRDYGSAAFSVP